MTSTKRRNGVVIAKVAFAMFAIVFLVSIPARRLAPGLTVLELTALILAAGVALTVIAIGNLMVAQWVLRQGGTDTQWLWFYREPPGLEKLREEERQSHSAARGS